MKITIHRGSHQIGGCITEYEQNGWRVFVDYGEQLPGETAPKRLEIEGLNKGDLSKSILLITHYHEDHIGRIEELSKKISVYMGETGLEIYKKLQKRLSHIKGPEGEKAKKKLKRLNNIHTFSEEDIIEFGSFTITPIQVDHSAYDAYGFHITDDTEIGVFHTGDFRNGSVTSENFYEFIERIPESHVLVCEGTNIDRPTNKSGETLEEQFIKNFKEYKYNFVYVSSTNISRLFDIYESAIEAEKILVMDDYQYEILKTVVGKPNLRECKELIEVINEDGEKELVQTETTYNFNNGNIFHLRLSKNSKSPRFYIPENLMKLMKWKGFVMLTRTSEQFEDLISQFNPEHSKKYLSIWDGYLNPSSSAYNEKLAKAIGKKGEYEYIHKSGHVDRDALGKLFWYLTDVETIIPIHTPDPQRFREFYDDYSHCITLLKDGETFDPKDKE